MSKERIGNAHEIQRLRDLLVEQMASMSVEEIEAIHTSTNKYEAWLEQETARREEQEVQA